MEASNLLGMIRKTHGRKRVQHRNLGRVVGFGSVFGKAGTYGMGFIFQGIVIRNVLCIPWSMPTKNIFIYVGVDLEDWYLCRDKHGFGKLLML